jgi:methionyl aminopeptidase
MSISTKAEMSGMQQVSQVVGTTLRLMRERARPGMTTKELDQFGGSVLTSYGAKPAPLLTYGFPGNTCISVNEEVAHGVPSNRILREGDLINIDVSAELNGFWADNGGSFVLGRDLFGHQALVDTSKAVLREAITSVRAGQRIAELGRIMESRARKAGFAVIRNLVGHGIGRSLHEAPHEIPCYYDKWNRARFKKNSVVAIETFISTKASLAHQTSDGWTLKTKDGSFVAQHEHTLVITDGEPIILTITNGIF